MVKITLVFEEAAHVLWVLEGCDGRKGGIKAIISVNLRFWSKLSPPPPPPPPDG